MSFLGSFDHTTGATWGGSQLSPSVLKIFATLGGFFGLDHILLRSPKTGLLKFLVNCISLGFWYWYDIVQVFGDMEFVQKYGYSIPGLGPVGLGAGILHSGTNTGMAPETSPSPFIFLAYTAMILVPFGFSHFIAGDTAGGAMKFLLTYLFFTFFLGIAWALYSGFMLVFNTQEILEKGTDRMFPATLFMDPFGAAANLTIPKTIEDDKKEEEASSFFNWIFGFLGLGFLKPIQKPILEGIVSAGDAVTNVASSVKQSAEMIEETKTAPAVTELLQKGGALLPATASTPVFLGIAGLILVGALVTTAFRFQGAKQTGTTSPVEKTDVPPEVSDEPPSGSRAF